MRKSKYENMGAAEARAYDSGYKNGKFDGFVEAAKQFDQRVKATELAIQVLGQRVEGSKIVALAQEIVTFWKGDNAAK